MALTRFYYLFAGIFGAATEVELFKAGYEDEESTISGVVQYHCASTSSV